MDKYKRYYGVGIFLLTAFVLFYGSYNLINPKIGELTNLKYELEKKQS